MLTLIAAGGPAAPVPTLRLINSTLLVLEWDSPFTWPYTTIQHYSVFVNSTSESWNLTSTNDRLLEIRANGAELEECTVYSFMVRANNGLADGQLGTVIGGFPVGM